MKDFWFTLFGDMTTGAFWAYFLLAITGMILSWVTQYADNRKSIKESGGFQKSVWFIENWYRLVANPLAIILIIILYKDIEGEDISKFGAVQTGLMADVLIDRIRGALRK